MTPSLLLLIIVVLTIHFSFVCSILEAALLSANMATLVDKKEKGSVGAALLLRIKRERMEDGISAILCLNTSTNGIGAILTGAQASLVWVDKEHVAIFTASFVLGILIFGEIIPKTLGNLYAIRMVELVGRSVYWLTILLYPFVFISRRITGLFTGKGEDAVTRGDVSAMVSLAMESGAITRDQSYLFLNLLGSDEVSLADVMTPRSVITMISAEAQVEDFLHYEEIRAFSRIPVYEDGPDDIKGYVIVRQVMAAALKHGAENLKLSSFIRPAIMLPKSYSVGDSLRRLTRTKEHLALVLDEYGTIRGLITLEDLIETILGIEIIDESDKEVDMRDVALKIRDKRLQLIEQRKAKNSS